MSFQTTIALFILCLDDLSLEITEILKSSTIIVLLSTFPFCLLRLTLYVLVLLYYMYICIWVGFPEQQLKNAPAIQDTLEIWVQSLDWEDSLEEEMATHSSILSWKKSHGQRCLVGYSSWDLNESGTTEQFNTSKQACTRVLYLLLTPLSLYNAPLLPFL